MPPAPNSAMISYRPRRVPRARLIANSTRLWLSTGAYHDATVFDPAGAIAESKRTPTQLAISSPFQRSQNLTGGVCAGPAVQSGPGVRAGSAEEQMTNRRRVPSPTQQRPRHEELIDRELAVENVAAGQSVPAFEIPRRDHLPRDDGRREVRRVAGDRPRGGIAKAVPRGVPRLVPQVVGRVLHVCRDYVLIARRQSRIKNRRNRQLDPRLL